MMKLLIGNEEMRMREWKGNNNTKGDIGRAENGR